MAQTQISELELRRVRRAPWASFDQNVRRLHVLMPTKEISLQELKKGRVGTFHFLPLKYLGPIKITVYTMYAH